MVTAETGHLLALGAIDAVDDTVLVRKMLVAPLCKELDELMKDNEKVTISLSLAFEFCLFCVYS